MRKICFVIYSLILALSLLAVPTSAKANTLPLDPIVYKNYNPKSSFGISIRDYQTGKILYAVNGDIPRSPASSLKLLTGAAALHTLGINYRFTTNLYYDGTITNGVLNGDIYVKGTGDPTFQYSDFNNFAKQLKSIGINHVNGYVRADDSIFSGPIRSPGVMPHEEDEYYAGTATAITMSPDNNYNAGTINFNVVGSWIGGAPYYGAGNSFAGLQVVNMAKTVQKGERNTLTIKRASGSNQIVISGNIPVGATVKKVITMPNPTTNSLITFTEAMHKVGITFQHQYIVAYGKVPSTATYVTNKKSMTLGELYPHFMKKSNNVIADTLVKSMGYAVYGVGDLANGIKVLKNFGTELGLTMNDWTIVDGSGLSARNKISPHQLSLFMYKVRSTPNYKTFYNGLIVGGHPDRFHAGALNNRFTDWNTRYHIIGKTGYISGTHSLTGIAQGFYSRNVYLFSIMSDNYGGSIQSIDNVMKHVIIHY